MLTRLYKDVGADACIWLAAKGIDTMIDSDSSHACCHSQRSGRISGHQSPSHLIAIGPAQPMQSLGIDKMAIQNRRNVNSSHGEMENTFLGGGGK